MRIHVLLLPDSMPLTLHLRLLVASPLLLLLLCSSTSCLGTPYQDCLEQKTFTCGKIEFGYPFGIYGSGCGEPDFQLYPCEPSDGVPLINIGGNEYQILKFSYSQIDNKSAVVTIVNDNMLEDRCNPSGNYSQFWTSASSFHINANVYTNLSLWNDCNNQGTDDHIYKDICGVTWHYGWSLPAPPCKSIQLPFPKSALSDDPHKLESELKNGFEISWFENAKCVACMKSNGTCGYNTLTPATFLCHCPNGISHQDNCTGRGRNKSAIIIGCSIGGVALIAIAVLLFFICYKKKRKFPSRGIASRDMEAAVLPPRKTGNLPIFSYEELRQATNCFHEENEVGDGGFGSVYLGKLLDGRTVAVKRLYQDNSRRVQQFINEVEIFSTLKHPRVVRLYGCTSADSPELLLVYEFVANGTLADHLHGERRSPWGLPWDTRLNIAIQIAEALDFLHSVNPPIFHRDVKSSNILLDENFDVKVADFGLCRLVPVNASHVTTAPQGTPGYVDPEYHQCYQLTEKSDVYSFGVVLVEIISAKLAVDINRNRSEINLANMAKSKIQEGALHELVDLQLGIEMNHEVKVTVTAVAELAFRCLASERDDRPHMKEVVAQLEEIKQSWDTSIGPDKQQRESFSNIKQPLSPISVQDKWSSISSTPNTSE